MIANMQYATAAQLRDDIDCGLTGDKVCWPDPAAAPLGTDEEAAGVPTSPEQFALARAHHAFVAVPGTPPNAGWVLVASTVVIGVSLIGAGFLL